MDFGDSEFGWLKMEEDGVGFGYWRCEDWVGVGWSEDLLQCFSGNIEEMIWLGEFFLGEFIQK